MSSEALRHVCKMYWAKGRDVVRVFIDLGKAYEAGGRPMRNLEHVREGRRYCACYWQNVKSVEVKQSQYEGLYGLCQRCCLQQRWAVRGAEEMLAMKFRLTRWDRMKSDVYRHMERVKELASRAEFVEMF